MDLPDKALGCHRTGFAKKCRALVVSGSCKRWERNPGITGKHPNTGEDLPSYDCKDNWQYTATLVGNAQMHQLGSAIESFRNEMVRANAEAISYNGSVQRALSLLPATGNPIRLLEGRVDAKD